MIKNKKINKKSFFKKSFIKIARKLGYELIDQSDLTVITKNKNISEDKANEIFKKYYSSIRRNKNTKKNKEFVNNF